MSAKDNGGQAFPVPGGPIYGNGDPLNYPEPGMTLRDYFAAQQMSRIASGWPNADNMQRIAADCYAMADAMIAERQK